MSTDFVELLLTCENRMEAEEIAQSLLERHLVACVKFEPVHSKFWWKDKLEQGDEVKISMLSIADNFESIEAEVTKLHSYETFVLQAIEIAKLNDEAMAWLTESTK